MWLAKLKSELVEVVEITNQQYILVKPYRLYYRLYTGKTCLGDGCKTGKCTLEPAILRGKHIGCQERNPTEVHIGGDGKTSVDSTI